MEGDAKESTPPHCESRSEMQGLRTQVVTGEAVRQGAGGYLKYRTPSAPNQPSAQPRVGAQGERVLCRHPFQENKRCLVTPTSGTCRENGGRESEGEEGTAVSAKMSSAPPRLPPLSPLPFTLSFTRTLTAFS